VATSQSTSSSCSVVITPMWYPKSVYAWPVVAATTSGKIVR